MTLKSHKTIEQERKREQERERRVSRSTAAGPWVWTVWLTNLMGFFHLQLDEIKDQKFYRHPDDSDWDGILDVPDCTFDDLANVSADRMLFNFNVPLNTNGSPIFRSTDTIMLK